MPFEFKKLEIPEMLLVDIQSFADEQGAFMEILKN